MMIYASCVVSLVLLCVFFLLLLEKNRIPNIFSLNLVLILPRELCCCHAHLDRIGLKLHERYTHPIASIKALSYGPQENKGVSIMIKEALRFESTQALVEWP